MAPKARQPAYYFAYREQEESTIEYKKPANLEKEGKVVFDMLEGFFPRRGGGRKPPTTYSSMEEETLIDCNQAAKAYGGVVFASYPNRPTPKVVNKLHYRRGF